MVLSTRNRHFMGAASMLALMLLALESEAAAQTGAGASASPPEDQAGSADIVVTGRLRAERLQDVPIAVTALSGATIAEQAVVDVQGISKLVPMMVVGRQVSGSAASIFLRGVGSSSLSSGFDQSVALNLDGIAMTRGREIVNAQYDIRQVEVMKGPQALFFGKNSTGGVVAITTADPGARFEAMAKLGYEFVADERYAEGFVSGPLTDSLGVRFAGRVSKMDGFFVNTAQPNALSGLDRTVSSRRVPYGESLSGRLTVVYDPGDGFDATLKLSATHMEDSGVAYERLCGGGRTTPLAIAGIVDPYADCKLDGRLSTANVPQEIAATMDYARRDGKLYTEHNSRVAMLRLNKTMGPITLTSITGYYRFRQGDQNNFGGAAAGTYNAQQSYYRQISQELRALTDFDGPVNLTAGLFFADGKMRYDFGTLNLALAPAPGSGRLDSFTKRSGFSGKTYSAFGELKWNIMPTLELAGGARWTKEKKDSYVQTPYVHPLAPASTVVARNIEDHFRDDNVSPQATLTWKPTPDLTLYAAYKQGFKSGGYNTSLTFNATTDKSFGEFGSEKAEGQEVGLRAAFFRRALHLNVTAYDYDYKGLQVQVYNAITQVQRVQNAGNLRTRGIEAEAVLAVPGVPGFELRGAAAYNKATYSDYLAACYTGQTIAGGCNLQPGPSGAFTSQDVEGRQAPKAPKYAAQLGASYDFALSGPLRLALSGGMQYTSRYNYSDALRPDAIQKGFTRWDAAVRLRQENAGWEVALIGRNLTNEYVITSASDVGRTGGGTGTAAGVVGDINAIVERPREVHLQFSIRF
ncbi:TonB-dependent receptor [Sphingobium jiangsuense]|uniref:Outer membrane receptor protein involved in Fe transport n=1 Tax=Sphingobium jiangsuense TaxID=870476 RepID=A0A7W6BFA2_9SPHN|nr:TonB-dependent receptor [Sphingobium jiangsuense]MBB3925833.1 outer membrane receptor protein involved in Fe transport [Sphingobium jiangsuense]GLT01828.1 TonB-dependent receptor [Sphingobium jiangsuense]